MFRIILFCCWIGLLPSLVQAQALPKKYALLVAVTTYQHTHLNQPPKIQFPEADAVDIADELRKAGYQIDLVLGEEATQEKIREKLGALDRQGNGTGVLLIGFFGHGVEYSQTDSDGKVVSRSFFCPYDAAMEKRLDSVGREIFDDSGKLRIQPKPSSLISMSEVFEAIRLSPAGNRVLLADCCRDDPHAARGRSGFGAGIRQDDLPDNAKIAAIFACSKGEQALEDQPHGHGVFSKCVLDWLREPQARATAGRLGEHLEEAVPSRVKELTDQRRSQTPRYLNVGTVDLQLASLSPNRPLPPVMKPGNPPPSPETGPGNAITNSINMKLVRIPAGEFLMGSPDSDAEAREDEKPQHRVRITRDFYLGQTEVTQGQWKSVMGTEPWKGESYVREGADYPATLVSWKEASEFCRKLSAKEGKNYRLPTEAEWEYACRGGTQTWYSFGDEESRLGDYGWFEENAYDVGGDYAHRVGQKKANPFGLYDMHGNVLEWCSDRYNGAYYRDSPVDDPSCAVSGSDSRVFRGGCWDSTAEDCRSAFRDGDDPSYRGFFLGFRVALSP